MSVTKKITAKTGKATIVQSGHTASTKHGANPDARAKGEASVRDLSAK